MDSSLPHRTPGASGHEHGVPRPEYGIPSRELRERAAEGWERFLDRFDDGEPDGEPDHAGYERHPLLGRQVRDVASQGEGELMAVTHEVHDDGRVVRVAHIRPASGVEWSTAVANIQAAR
ncbi:hypothetical protein [Streptomyces sp. CC208A]|uniref:hypothetical protein n=1 Tax=Streptomyces sp. CC208A TaxID=3044573 RepID=UPI0024A7E3A5|nr:hypothetical protein [Streptomyces sp. CC208A]